MMRMFNLDASKCTYYELMELIDTDDSECADLLFRRSQRQMEKTLKRQRQRQRVWWFPLLKKLYPCQFIKKYFDDRCHAPIQ